MSITNKEVNAAIKKAVDLKAKIAALEIELKALSPILTEGFDTFGDVISTGNHIGKRVKYTATVFDTTAFRAEHSDLYSQYCKSVERVRHDYK